MKVLRMALTRKQPGAYMQMQQLFNAFAIGIAVEVMNERVTENRRDSFDEPEPRSRRQELGEFFVLYENIEVAAAGPRILDFVAVLPDAIADAGLRQSKQKTIERRCDAINRRHR